MVKKGSEGGIDAQEASGKLDQRETSSLKSHHRCRGDELLDGGNKMFAKKLGYTVRALGTAATMMFGASGAAIADDMMLKIGFVGPYSGASAEYTEAGKRGAMIAIDEFNATWKGKGYQAELVEKDDVSNPTQGVNAVNDLVFRDKVIAVMGPVNSGVFKPTVPVTKEAGVLQLAWMPQDSEFTRPVSIPNVFRFAQPNFAQAKQLAQYMVKKKGLKRIGVIHDNTAYGKPGAAEFIAELKALGLEPVGDESFNMRDAEVTAQLLKLKEAGADAILVWALGNDQATVKRGMLKLDMDVPLFGANSMVSLGFWTVLGDLSKNAYTTYFDAYAKENITPNAKVFADKYFKRYGNDKYYGPGKDPYFYLVAPAQAYDALTVTLKTAVAAKGDPKKMVSIMEAQRDVPGVLGTVNFSPDNHDAYKSASYAILEVGAQGPRLFEANEVK
jgi:branched-chain amino acid transport system substrate-binding protein